VIDAKDLTVRIGTRELIVDASFRVDAGMRIGLVGRNGAGKTTLTRLLAGGGATSGVVEATGAVNRRGTVGYLPQDTHEGDPSQTVRERILSVRGIDETIRRIRKAERDMAAAEGARQAKAMERYVRLDQEFTAAGGWAASAEAAQMAAALGLPERVLDQALGTLSGGQRRRVELARILFSQAETLLLDEPTNHLDHDSVLWLRDYLRAYRGGFVVISHSVDLLAETVNAVWHLDANRAALDVYNMGWRDYLSQRETDERRRRRERANAVNKADALMRQADKMRAKATKAVAAQNMARHCTGCQLCVAECPNDVLRPSTGLLHLMQPVMSYERGYCRPECNRCSQICPTGAIKPISRAEKTAVHVGHAVWVKKNCVPVTDGVECGNCARHCPVGAIEMVPLDEADMSSPFVPAVNEERCIGCGACENLCPARPFSAIYVEGHEMQRTDNDSRKAMSDTGL